VKTRFMIAWLLCGLAAVSCSRKETLQTTMLASVPDSGTLSTTFTIPDSQHVFLLLGWRGADPGRIQGEITLASKHATNVLLISKNNPDANWLRHLGLSSILVTTHSMTAETVDSGRHRPGAECKLRLAITNAPRSSAVYLGFLR
jgi:hypothetical protein